MNGGGPLQSEYCQLEMWMGCVCARFNVLCEDWVSSVISDHTHSSPSCRGWRRGWLVDYLSNNSIVSSVEPDQTTP